MKRNSRRRFKLSKDAVIDGLTRGKSINQIVKDHGYKSTSTVASWRDPEASTYDADFATEVNRLLQTPMHQLRLRSQTTPIKELAEDPKSRFLFWYRDHNDRNESCNYANVQPSEVVAWLDPGSSEYDAKFAHEWEQMRLRRSWKVDDMAINAAVGGDMTMLRFVAPAELPEKYGRSGRNVGINVDRVNIFGAPSLQEAAEFLKTLFADPTADPQPVRALVEGAERDATRAGDARHVALGPA